MMKKTIVGLTIMAFVLVSQVAFADQVNMNISVNGEANLNITVDADDTLAREMIAQTQLDTYGTTTGSGPKDMLLDEIEAGYGNPVGDMDDVDQIKEMCNDPFMQNYLDQIGALPPLDFINYLKGLGYDDEAHINFVWTICQQEYIKNHETSWNQDLIGGGLQQGDLVAIVREAINWLIVGGDSVYANAKELGTLLDSYFATDRDVWILSNKIKQLEMRIEALERTTEKTAAEEYCDTKLEMMDEYDLTNVKCGTNSTIYWNADGFEGYDIIAYNDCSEDWVCTDWSECVDGVQVRRCMDREGCGTFFDKPEETQTCAVTVQQNVETVNSLPVSVAPVVESFEATPAFTLEGMLPTIVILFVSVDAALVVFGILRSSKAKSSRKSRK